MTRDCRGCDVVERNARLIVRLRHVAAMLHAERGHAATLWVRCPLEPCVDTLALIEGTGKKGGERCDGCIASVS